MQRDLGTHAPVGVQPTIYPKSAGWVASSSGAHGSSSSRVDPVLVAEAQWITAEAKAKTGDTQGAIVLATRALATIDGGAGAGWPSLRADVVGLLAEARGVP